MADNLLLVEDDAVVRRDLAHLLRNNGYSVTEATDGVEAEEYVNEEQFSLIIIDIVLPKMHGLNLIKVIRSRWPTTPIIVISGHLSQSGGTAILEWQADFLPKPVDAALLLSRIRRSLP